jgi:hypothetical protein
MAMNVENLCVTAFLLSLGGRNEVLAREVGVTISDMHSRGDPSEKNLTSTSQREGPDVADADLSRD